MANIDALKILGSLMNSGALSHGSSSNALGSMIGAVTGGGQSTQSGGNGLGGLFGGILGGGQSGSGGLGALLGGLLGRGSPSSGGGLGDLLGMAVRQFGAARQGDAPQAHDNSSKSMPRGMDYRQAEQQAEVLIRGMINAAKADGRVDADEQAKIIGQLGDVTQDELEFIERELAAPLDVQGFVRSIPRGMEQQVYTVSLMAIDLDSHPEARYLHELAQGVGISADVCNQLHEQVGAQRLYG